MKYGSVVGGIILVTLLSFMAGQEKTEQASPKKPKTFRPSPFTVVSVVKIDTLNSTIVLKGTVKGTEQELTLKVQADSKLMKDGKDAKLSDFKEGEQLLVTWRSLKKKQLTVRYLADPVTFFAFLRHPILHGRVKQILVATSHPPIPTLILEVNGKDYTLLLPKEGDWCFVENKTYSDVSSLKVGLEVTATIKSQQENNVFNAHAVFDSTSWKLYGERGWNTYKQRTQARKKKQQNRQN